MQERRPHARTRSGARGPCKRAVLGVLLAWAALLSPPARAQELQDFFTNRIVITNFSGQILQDNSAATVEPGEPKHGGKTGGHSLWISWRAISNGVVSFKTETSGFDTLLSAYKFTTTNGATFADLREVARADDSEGFERESEIEFGVAAGDTYEIAADGYFGAAGMVDFRWEFKPLPTPPPQILNTLADRAVNRGDSLALAFTVTNAAAGDFRWFLNGIEINGANSTNLVVPSFNVVDVGRYKMRVSAGGEQYFSVPVEIQINTEGVSNALAQGKILDAPDTALIGGSGGGPLMRLASLQPLDSSGSAGVVRGYNGSQIFNTTYAVVDTNEPPHCGISGGASYWLYYQPPANGNLALDTIGSTYDTVMEAYTFDGALSSYADLTSIQCDNDGVGTNGASRVQFPVVKTRQYLVVVEGVNGGRGSAWLNYQLNTNQSPSAPTLLSPPQSVSVAEGSPALLAAAFAGAPPLRFSWKKNTTPMPGLASPAIYLPCTTNSDTANYIVTVTNDLGSSSATVPLRVLVQPSCSLSRTSTWLQLGFPTRIDQQYTVEEAPAVTGPWAPWPTVFIGDGQPLVLNVPRDGTRFYRVRVE